MLGDSGGKVLILGYDIIDNFTEKKVHMNVCLILNGHGNRAI
jgi:hypothetical protein